MRRIALVIASFVSVECGAAQSEPPAHCIVVEPSKKVDTNCEENKGVATYETVIRTASHALCPNKVLVEISEQGGEPSISTATRNGVPYTSCNAGINAKMVAIVAPDEGSYPPPIKFKDGQDRRLIFGNFTSGVITKLIAVDSNNKSSENLLQHPLKPEATTIVDIHNGTETCIFYLEAWTKEDVFASTRGADVCQQVEWILYDEKAIEN